MTERISGTIRVNADDGYPDGTEIVYAIGPTPMTISTPDGTVIVQTTATAYRLTYQLETPPPFAREMAALDALTDEQFAVNAAAVLALAEAVPPALGSQGRQGEDG